MLKLYILEALLLVALLYLGFSSGGCAMLKGFQNPDTEIAIPPTPEVQLWQAAKKSNWLVTASILGIAAGVFAMMNGATKLGMASIASASVSLFMSLAVSRFALWMAVLGLIGSAAAALFSVLARRKALVEIITGVQGYKNASSSVLLRGKLNKQSNTTKKIVSAIKTGLKLKGAI